MINRTFMVDPDHHDDQNSIKQALISSYKKSLYHIMRAEIHRNSHGSDGSASGPLSSRVRALQVVRINGPPAGGAIQGVAKKGFAREET
ncbi:hypothetical protein CK203_092105 [Vitis vinifera]|uniref:Uncharacterized protein n=1 Tax=Vitis vinifera TaxID=29760 RepID=A0A438ED24_VITVI|nr:hypothetical protein CK203_092105 [Vitis vinifera]